MHAQPSLAQRIRDLRVKLNLSMDELASKAGISKTYLWELENDETGIKKPSADVLLKIANALDTTIGNLLAVPTVRFGEADIEISPSLREFADKVKNFGTDLSEKDLKDLAAMNFRGGQPQTFEDWLQLYLVLSKTNA